jgi:hypothetical protein
MAGEAGWLAKANVAPSSRRVRRVAGSRGLTARRAPNHALDRLPGGT